MGDRCGPPAAVGSPATAEGRWSRLSRPVGRRRSPAACLGRPLLDRYGVLRARSSPSNRRRRPGAISPRSWRGPNGAASFAAVTSSRGSRACSMPRTRPPPELARLAAAAAGIARPSSSSRPPIRRTSTGPEHPSTSSSRRRRRAPAARPGQFPGVRDGRPVLIIESYGKRLTGLAWASQADIDSALKLLPSLTGPRPNPQGRNV